jgi:hypothetical protein
MGGSSSKSVVTKLSEVITNIAVSSVLDCQTSTKQDQNVLIANTGLTLFGSYKLEQQSDIKSSCFTDSKRQTQLQNDIINAITQASTSSGSSFLPTFGKTSSSSKANLTSIVRNSITSSNLQKNYNTIKQTQNVTFRNTGLVGFQQLQLTQGAQIFAASTLKSLDDAGVFNGIKSHIDQTSSASNSLFNFGSLFGSLGSFAYVLIFAVVAFVGYFMYNKYQSKSKRAVPIDNRQV